MKIARWKHAACVFRRRVFVVGGLDRQGNFVSKIECYDPITDTWCISAENSGQFAGHAPVVI